MVQFENPDGIGTESKKTMELESLQSVKFLTLEST